jgi:LysM repeat protein
MAMTRTEWNNLQKKLPPNERESYETYLAYNPPTPTPAAPAKPTPTPTPTTPAPTPAATPAATTPKPPVNRVTVEQGQTLKDIAKENNTTVAAILALPGNATIAARVEAGTQPVFGNSKVVIPSTPTPVPADVALTAMPTPTKSPGEPEFVGPVATPQPAEKLLPKLNNLVDELGKSLADLYISQGLNADGTKKPEPVITATQKAQAARAAEAGLSVEEAAGNPMFNKAVQPVAPAGFRYTWIGGTDTGQWKLYANTGSTGAGAGMGGGGGAGSETTTAPGTGTPSTSVDVLKALLRAQGLSSKILDSSTSYLNSLLKDNIDYDNAIALFLNTKEYTLKNGTKLTSPFYSEYGYLNEGLATPKDASELFNAVEGYKGIKQKYGLSDKYLSTESLKNYVKNNVTVLDLDERANAARLAAIQADPAKTDALIKLGYIATKEGLQDFYLDSKIGKEQLEVNRNTGAFVAEAIRRAGTGISTAPGQIEGMKALAATLTSKGYTEAQIAQLATTGFEEIGKTLEPLTKLENIYGVKADKEAIQKDLQTEEFLGMASELRKKRKEQEELAFKRKSGTMGASRGFGGSLGTTSTFGAV